MDRDADSGSEQKRQPTYRQMGYYAIIGGVVAALSTPLLYVRWMRRSPFPWLSSESFEGFGWFAFVGGIVIVLVLIGSHGDTEA